MSPVKFLLVDDLEENLLSLEALLRRDGLVLLKARSGDEALELVGGQERIAWLLLGARRFRLDGIDDGAHTAYASSQRWQPGREWMTIRAGMLRRRPTCAA